jgi:hypothetical protein
MSLYFIRTGILNLYKTVTLNGNKTQVLVSQKGDRDHVCEEGAIFHTPEGRTSQFTIKAGSALNIADLGNDAYDRALQNWVYYDEQQRTSERRNLKKGGKKGLAEESSGSGNAPHVLLAVVPIFEVRAKFLSLIKPSSILNMSESDAISIHMQKKQKSDWKRLKKKQMDLMVKEKSGNCLQRYWRQDGGRALPQEVQTLLKK